MVSMAKWLVGIFDPHGAAPMTGPRVGHIPRLSKVYEGGNQEDALAQAWAEWDQAYGYRPENPSVSVELRR